MINVHDVARTLGVPFAYPGEGTGEFKLEKTDGTRYTCKTWSVAARALGGTEFFMVKANFGHNVGWFRADDVAKLKELKLRWQHRSDPEKLGPIVKAVGPAVPCSITIAEDMGRWTRFSTCGRQAVGELAEHDRTVPACSMHIKTDERRKAKDAQWRAEWDEAKAKRKRDEETKRAIADTLERIHPLFEQLGFVPATVTPGRGDNDRLGICLPAETIEELVRRAVELEEMM